MEPKYTPLTNEQEAQLQEINESFSVPLIGALAVAHAVRTQVHPTLDLLMASTSYLEALIANLPDLSSTPLAQRGVNDTRIFLQTLKEERGKFIAKLQSRGYVGEFMA